MTKPTKWHVHPAKTQISLGICPVCSESSLSPWRNLGSLATYWSHSEDWSDWAHAQADLSLRWAQVILLVLSCGGSNDIQCRPRSDCSLRSTNGKQCIPRLKTCLSLMIIMVNRNIWFDIVQDTLWCHFVLKSNKVPTENKNILHQNFFIILLLGSMPKTVSAIQTVIWDMSWENLFMPYANNKGTDQPAHPHSLISASVVRYLGSIMPILAISDISRL